jgi:hypothetical protein
VGVSTFGSSSVIDTRLTGAATICCTALGKRPGALALNVAMRGSSHTVPISRIAMPFTSTIAS